MTLVKNRTLGVGIYSVIDPELRPPDRRNGYRDAGAMFTLKLDNDCAACAYGGWRTHQGARPYIHAEIWPPIPPKVRWP